jgi:hypothetical protein
MINDNQKTKDNGYLGNPNIKRDGVNINFTKEQIDEYIKCSKDPIHFCETYLKVIHLDRGLVPFKLYGYQRKIFHAYNSNRFNIVLACRQSGKSISTCGYLLWYALFHSEKTIAILANKGATAREMLSRISLMLENLPFWLQPGCKALNKGNIDFSNNSRIISAATSSSSIRGMSISLLFLDEFAFVDNASEFYTGVYPVISSGKDTKVIITSTPNGIGNMFYKLWEGAIQGANEFKPFTIRWNDVPGRDEEWKRQTIANSSELQFRQEFSCDFIGSSQTLISSDTLLGLQARDPIYTKYGIRYYAEPTEGHDYIMTVDVSKGRGQDYSTFTVFDISSNNSFSQVCTYRDNLISPLMFPELIVRAAKIYNNALVIIENNDAGQVVCNAIYHDYEYDNTFVQSSVKSSGIGVTMTKRVKRIGCSNLKDLIEGAKLHICDPDAISELSSFEPKGDSYSARGSTHDDMVMNLVLFAWFVSTDAFGGMSPIELKDLLYSEKLKEMEDDALPFPVLTNNGASETNSINHYERQIQDLQEWNML